ncbi:MAG: hypothetical protein AAF288_14360 [Planctomycetota bacterium]
MKRTLDTLETLDTLDTADAPDRPRPGLYRADFPDPTFADLRLGYFLRHQGGSWARVDLGDLTVEPGADPASVVYKPSAATPHEREHAVHLLTAGHAVATRDAEKVSVHHLGPLSPRPELAHA